MCGIIGYIGSKNPTNVVLDGLTALEYRGYDSAGLAALTRPDHIELLRTVGRVQSLRDLTTEQKLSKSSSAIGHTRWATHGAPTVTNAHPHANTNQTIFVVHN